MTPKNASKNAPSFSLGFAHEIGLALVCFSSILLVILGGSFPLLAWAVLGAPLLAAGMSSRRVSAPSFSGTLIAFAAFATAVAQILSRGLDTLVYGGGILLLGLLAARLLTKKTLEHDLQAMVLSLLLVLAGSVLNVKLSFAPVFIVYAIAFVWALSTRQLLLGGLRAALERGEPPLTAEHQLRNRKDVAGFAFFFATSSVAFIVLASTLILFFTFPRVGWGNLDFMRQKGGQFPAQVSLKGPPRGASGSGEVVARLKGVSFSQWNHGLYLRGGVYDKLTADGFSRRQTPIFGTEAEVHLAKKPENFRYEVFLTPHAGNLLFSLGHVESAYAISGGASNPRFKTYIQGVSPRSELKSINALRSPLRYSITGSLALASDKISKHQKGPHLDLIHKQKAWLETPKTDARVLQMLQKITQGKTNDVEIVNAIRAYLLTQYSYTLTQPSGLKKDPLTAFLLEDKAGHCEYFATAFTLLLRLKGIPARVIGGYQGGLYDNKDQVVVFTTQHAHAWIEWFSQGAGWITDDATPIAGTPGKLLEGPLAWLERLQRFWDDSIVDYALDDQLDALRGAANQLSDPNTLKTLFFRGLFSTAAFSFLLFLFFQLRKRNKQKKNTDFELSQHLIAALNRILQTPVSMSATHREAIQKAQPLVTPIQAKLLAKTLKILEAHRYGNHPLPAKECDQLKSELQKIQHPQQHDKEK